MPRSPRLTHAPLAAVLTAVLAAACGSDSKSRHAIPLEDAGDAAKTPVMGSGGRPGTGGAPVGGAAGRGGTGGSVGTAGAGGADSGTSPDASLPDASVVPDGSVVPDATVPNPDGASRDGAVPPGCIPTTGAPSLVAHWTGDSTFDDTTDAHNGSAVGTVTFVAGVVGNAFHFQSGALNYVNVSVSPSLDLTSFTIAGWVRVPAGQNAWATLIAKEHHGIPAPWLDRNYGLLVGNSAGGCHLGGASLLETGGGICSTKVVNDGAWHHLAGTSDGCTLKIYVDGTFIESAPAGVIPTGPTQNVRLGAWNITGTEDLDEVKIYAGAMSAAEVGVLAQ